MPACRSDWERVCIGGTTAIHCLSINWEELSPSCRDAVRGWNASQALSARSIHHPTHIKPIKNLPKAPPNLPEPPPRPPKPPPDLPKPPPRLPEKPVELRASGAASAPGRKSAASARRGPAAALPADGRDRR